MKHALIVVLFTSVASFQHPTRILLNPRLRARRHSLGRKNAAVVTQDLRDNLTLDTSPIHPVSTVPLNADNENHLIDSSSKPDDWLDKLNCRLEGGIGSMLLLFATCVSVALANTAFAPGWLSFWNNPSGLRVGQEVLSFRAIVNEGLMALFFFMVGLEIKDEIVDGSLSSFRSAVLPCIAACGGMLVPMAVYALINLAAGPTIGSMSGVMVPMATDIAFAMGIYSLFGGGRKFPAAVSTFLLTLATVDDLGAIFVMATCFSQHISIPFLCAAACVQAVLVSMERRKLSNAKMYIPVGSALWYCLLRGGVNADIAGALTGVCIHATKGDTKFLHRLTRRWKPICALAIMPLFALANTAVPLVGPAAAVAATAARSRGASCIEGRAVSIASGIFGGLCIGKPLGIVGSSWLAVRLGLADFPQGMTQTHLGVVGLLGGIGFTMCICLIEQALPAGRASTLSKVAVMAASGASAALGALVISRASDNRRSPSAPVAQVKSAPQRPLLLG